MAKKRKGFLSKNHTKDRRQYIDYDYIHKLSEEEKEWLSRFTDEEYGASFELNPIFVKYNELTPEHQKITKNNKLFSNVFIQIYKNTKKDQINLDLRKLRYCTKYYRNNNGEFTTDERFKYSNNNINDASSKEKRKPFNKKVKDMRNDLYGVGLKESPNLQSETFNNTNPGRHIVEHHILDTFDYELSYEDKLILMEEAELEEKLEEN